MATWPCNSGRPELSLSLSIPRGLPAIVGSSTGQRKRLVRS
jgi:hypothetical protein